MKGIVSRKQEGVGALGSLLSLCLGFSGFTQNLMLTNVSIFILSTSQFLKPLDRDKN